MCVAFFVSENIISSAAKGEKGPRQKLTLRGDRHDDWWMLISETTEPMIRLDSLLTGAATFSLLSSEDADGICNESFFSFRDSLLAVLVQGNIDSAHDAIVPNQTKEASKEDSF